MPSSSSPSSVRQRGAQLRLPAKHLKSFHIKWLSTSERKKTKKHSLNRPKDDKQTCSVESCNLFMKDIKV